MLQIEGNGWKAIDFPYTVTEDTVLEFEFRSDAEGEIHGIGFDNDNSLSAEYDVQAARYPDLGQQRLRRLRVERWLEALPYSRGRLFYGRV